MLSSNSFSRNYEWKHNKTTSYSLDVLLRADDPAAEKFVRRQMNAWLVSITLGSAEDENQ